MAKPKSRRKVIGEILVYATALSGKSFQEFDELVSRSGTTAGIRQRVVASGLPTVEEASFVDTITRNLRNVRFLLLIVGDEIREGLDEIAYELHQHPGMGVHLELVEVRVLRHPTERWTILVPTIVGRTHEVTCAVIDIRRAADDGLQVQVPPGEELEPARNRFKSMDEFATRASEHLSDVTVEGLVPRPATFAWLWPSQNWR